MKKTIVIGLGHKARQGKDWVAKEIANSCVNANVHILRFASALYKEARNENRNNPLLALTDIGGSKYLIIAGRDLIGQILVPASEHRKVVEFLESRGQRDYWRMEGKDAEFLQIWGDEIRRRMFGENYWTDKVKEEIEAIKESEGINIILIPDTRYKNELELIKNYGGYYIEVIRLNPDETRYIAKDRDSNHASETELDDVKSDYKIYATSGNLELLSKRAKAVMSLILSREGLSDVVRII